MFRDLGRVHIVSFAVGIVGLIIGIIGIVLAIVFGTAQTTCTTPPTPTCPPQATLPPCSTNLFAISTTVNDMKWDDSYGTPGSPSYNAAVQNITNTLTSSLLTGLNTQSSSSFLRILATTGPTSNNVKVEITQLAKDVNNLVVAIGNGAISAAADINTMPNSVNVSTVISQDKNYSDVKTAPQVCNTTVVPPDCPACSTAAPVECSTLPIQTTNTPLPTNPPTSSVAPVTTTTVPVVTTPTTTQTTTTVTSAKLTSSSGTSTTSQVTTQSTTTPTMQTTPNAQTSSTKAAATTVTTPGVSSTATNPATSTTPQATTTTAKGILTTQTSVASPSSSAPPITTQTTLGTPKPGTTGTLPISTTTQTVPITSPTTSPTTQGIHSSSKTPQLSTSSSQPVPTSSQILITSTLPVTSTQGVPSSSPSPASVTTSQSNPTSLGSSSQGPIISTQSQSPSQSTSASPVPSTSKVPLASTISSGTSTLSTMSSGVPSSSNSPTPRISSTQSVPTTSGSGSSSPSLSTQTQTHTQPQTSTFSSSTPSIQSTSTIPVTSSTAPGTSTAPPTIGPNQCYYRSNVALAVELTDPTSPIDIKMQNFIVNTLLFYPGNPYQLGKADSGMTQLALVPYPTYKDIEDIMNYGVATNAQRISGLFYSLGIFAGPDPEIYESLDFISNLTYSGSAGFVIIIGNNGTSVTKSMASSQNLQKLGFSIITIGYNTTDDFSSLASNPGLSFKVMQDSDELVVSQQIGNILNSTYCLSSSVAPMTSTATLVTSTTTVGVQSTSTAAASKTTISSTALPVQSSSSLPITSTIPPVTTSSVVLTSTAPIQSTSNVQSSSSASLGTSTASPTLAPGQCYYQSNVAVAFELTSSTDDIDLQIQDFIINNLFFYGGAPYQLGQPTDGKTELSLVPYPNDDTLNGLMTYGAASTQQTIRASMEVFQLLAKEPSQISDAFNVIPINSRIGPPGFVILVANSATSVQAAVDSATNLKALGFNIITVGFKSDGTFDALASQPSYNFQIRQDVDKSSVAAAIGNILNTTYCTGQLVGSTTIGSTVPSAVPTTTVTVPQGSSTPLIPSTTVTVPSAASTSMFRSSSTVSYTTTSGPTPTTCVCTTVEPGSTSPGYSTSTYATTMGSSSYSTAATPGSTLGSTTVPSQTSSSSPAQQTTTPAGSTSTNLQTTTIASSSSPSQQSSSSSSPQSTTSAVSTASTIQQTSTPGGSTSSPAQQSSTPGGSTSSPAQQSTNSAASTASTSQQSSTPGGSTSSPAQQSTNSAASTASTSQQSSTPGGSTSSPAQQSTSMGSSSSPSTQQSTTQSISSSSFTTSSGSSSYTTASTPSGASSSAPQSTTPSISSTVTVPSTVSTSSGPTTSQICPNQQTVFNGQIGVIYEMLPASAQQATINSFVENIILNSNFYGLAVDNLTHDNRTLVTAIPYPSTSQYNVQGYGSARSLSDFRSQVIAFNNAIQPVSDTSDISDALLYVTTQLPAGGVKSSLIIVGSSAALIDPAASALADDLKANFDIYTVSIGDNDILSALSSGVGYSFTGNTQDNADKIGLKMATSNPAIYCPPPIPSTSAPSTSTAIYSSTVPVTTSVASTTRVTTVRPTLGPCQCTGRWVYSGDLAIAFEYMTTAGSQNVTNFVRNTLLSNPDSYGLTSDVNGNQASNLTIVPYPDTSDYPIYPYGSIRSPGDIGNFIDAFSGIQSKNPDPSISSALDYINANLKIDSASKVVLIVGSDGSDVASATNSANNLKNAGYIVITVAQTASADVFRPLASGNQYALHIGDGNDMDVTTQIANLLLDISFVCYDNGSSTPSPITRCPGTQGTTQPGVTGTSTSAPVASSSSVGSTVPIASSSTAVNTGSTTVAVQTTQGSSSTASSGSSSTVGSTVTQGSTSTAPGSTSTLANTGSTTSSSGSSTTVAPGSSSTMGSTSTVANTGSTSGGSTISSGSSTQGSTTMGNTGSTTIGSTVTLPLGSSSTQASTVANTGSTTIGSTVTQGSSTVANTGSTTVGSTVTQPPVSSSSTAANTGSTITGSTTQPAASSSTVSVGSTTIGSTVTGQGSSSTQASSAANTGSTTVGSTVTQGSSTAANTGSTSIPVQSSTVASTVGSTQSILSSTTAVPLCANPYNGKIATVFELNTVQVEIQDVVTFVSSNLYNSANYDFSGVTQAINIPYGDTDQSAQYISQYGDAKSLADLQNNIETLYDNAVLTTNPTVSDGLTWLIENRDPDGTSGVIIVVGNHADDNYGLTLLNLETLRGQGYKVIAVAVGATHGDLSSIADKPEWYFQVGDSNGQSIANQISSILCNM